jgi:hypothetical protein
MQHVISARAGAEKAPKDKEDHSGRASTPRNLNLREKNEYVQYGCGLRAPDTWRNFDASPTLRLQRLPLIGCICKTPFFSKRGIPVWPGAVEYGDIVKGLPVERGSCRAIYCSNVLEHLSLSDFRTALGQTYGYLREGGIFRVLVPDLKRLAREYLASPDADACSLFMEKSGLGRHRRPRGVEGMLRAWWGNSSHLWMWDFKGIALELGDTGFSHVRPAAYNDSAELRFTDVESEWAWRTCIAVECTR